MEWYRFSAYNTESQYGYGSITEATEYLDFLNEDREINQYEYEVVRDQHLVADLENNRTDGFNISDVLNNV